MPKLPELKILLDTSVIHPRSNSAFVNKALSELVRGRGKHQQSKKTWFLPEIVIRERRYQMIETAKRQLAAWQDLQKLLGNSFDVSVDTVTAKVDEVIKASIKDLGIEVLPLDTLRVDWPDLIIAATDRLEPFSSGKSEKGFRDKLISEVFFQLANASPGQPDECLIVFVAADEDLSDYMKSREAELPNARILRSLPELEGLINLLTEHLDEALVARLGVKALGFFAGFFQDNVLNEIVTKYADELRGRPLGFEGRENQQVLLEDPEFLKHEGQRFFWVSRILVKAVGLVRDYSGPQSAIRPRVTGYNLPSGVTGFRSPSGTQGMTGFNLPSFVSGVSMPFAAVPSTPPMIAIPGQSQFKVTWSAIVEAGEQLRDAKVEDINAEGTTWG